MKKPILFLMLGTPAFFAVSCTTTESGPTYTLAAGSNSSVNGAALGGQFTTVGSNGAKFVLYATGRRGFHDNMTVHGLGYRWSSGVTDTVPEAYLGKPALFRNTMNHGVVQATLHAPGVLKVDTSRESSVTVNADVSIKSRRGTERRAVAVRFDRAAARAAQYQAGASRDAMLEIRRYRVPLGDLDVGANRSDWKPQ